MDAVIRNAEPSDAPFLAWAMQLAARSHLPRGFWDLLMPEAHLRQQLLELLANDPAGCHCHHGGFLIAEQDGQPVAALSGYEPLVKNEARFYRAVVASLDEMSVEPELLGELEGRVAPFLRCKPEFPDECWIVEWVAVRPEQRGRGIVDALLEEILGEGRRRGYTQAQLGYMLGNDRAERVYRRHGFEVVAARTDASMQAALDCPGVGRMRKVL